VQSPEAGYDVLNVDFCDVSGLILFKNTKDSLTLRASAPAPYFFLLDPFQLDNRET